MSAQYAYNFNGSYQYENFLFSYCTNGKVVCTKVRTTDVLEETDYDGQVSGDVSCYYEINAKGIPNGATLEIDYGREDAVPGTTKWFAYVSENMDGQAPYVF